MFLTVTPNPSQDQTLELAAPLVPGGVHRIVGAISQAGGKGINVARVLATAGLPVTALLTSPTVALPGGVPAAASCPVVGGVAELGLNYALAPAAGPARINIALTDANGQTTKVNGAGAPFTAQHAAALTEAVQSRLPGTRWLVLAGSLPPGLPPTWYAQMVELARAAGVKVAVDASDVPLAAIAQRLPAAAPHLIKPNSEELAQLVGADAADLEAAASAGDLLPVARAASALVADGVESVLATLGVAGAVLATADGAWFAKSPTVAVASTVGAGDSALAGYLIALAKGDDAPARLANAVAYGAAAAAQPGTGLATPALAAQLAAEATLLY
ncbi:MAG: hexose kinase [Buchananella hordeovulneris]|nr:hexose kinase [Buchananella hordeovulneris]